MKVKYILFVAFLCGGTVMHAQDNYFYFAWDVNTPLSNKAWIDNASTRGGKIGYRAFVKDNFSLGLDLSWITLDQYQPKETFQYASGAMTTDYFNYVYNYGAVVSSQYYFPVGEGQRFFPYAGIGLGANYNQYTRYYNIYRTEDTKWGFLARPEAGILIRFGARKSLGAMAAVHYDYSTNKSAKFNYKDFNTLGFQLGIMLMGR